MIWLTWRQFRGSAIFMGVVLVVVGGVLLLTGQGMAARYTTGLADCKALDNCNDFFDAFWGAYDIPFLGVNIAVLLLPALVGLFWGAPLITRELEAGTHLLVWNQSITRSRWLLTKLGVLGLAAMACALVAGLAVTWWSAPMDKSAASGFALMSPLVFDARGIVPMFYALFALILGVSIGLLVRRTLAAIALTLVVFVGLQLAMPLMVRPHLLTPVSAKFEIGHDVLEGVGMRGTGQLDLQLREAVATDLGAWVLTNGIVDPSGRVMADDEPIKIDTASGPCEARGPAEANGTDPLAACWAELNRQGYRQAVTYHPTAGFWPMQWAESAIYAVLTLGLTGFCFWWIRRRLS